MNEGTRVGRPRRSSREMIEDAAAELFLEQTYDGTTIDQIAQRAGVSRNTFFNYFAAKSDVLWVDLDSAIDRLGAALAASADDAGDTIGAVRDAMLSVVREQPSDRVPWAFTQSDLMRTDAELRASALTRFLRASGMLEAFITSSGSAVPARVFAYAALAAAVGAASSWVDAGTTRRSLIEYVRPALEPVCRAFGSESSAS